MQEVFKGTEDPLFQSKADIVTSEGLLEWYHWLMNECSSEIFKVIKAKSELLAYEYTALARNLSEGRTSYLFQRIEGSKNSIIYQLQRIYSHRNKIVHSGDMINEYSNLWAHLEWYVGKLLAYFETELVYKKENSSESLVDIFLPLDADYSYLITYLEKNEAKQISEMPKRIVDLLFKYPWQAN